MGKKWVYPVMIMLMELIFGVLYFACSMEEINTQLAVYVALAIGLLAAGTPGLLKSVLRLEIAQRISLGTGAALAWVIQLILSVVLLCKKSDFQSCILTEIGCIAFILLIEVGIYRLIKTR